MFGVLSLFPQSPDGISPHIWTHSGKTEWRGWRPSPADREQLCELIRQYLRPFQEHAQSYENAEEMMKTSSKKFEITDIANVKYPFLHRIRALRDVGIEVRAGDLGGFVEAECNLSQEEDDASWIFGDAIAAGSASVDKNSCLRDEAVACDQAYVTQRSTLSGHARAEDSVYIRGAVLSEEARAAGTAMVLDVKDKGKFPKLSGQCIVYGTVAGAVKVTGAAVILWEEKIRNDTLDTLILDGQSRSILRDPARDELKPSRSPKKQERTPKRKELDR